MDGQEVTRLETTYLPETNENRIRMYGADGELICEQIMAVDFGQEIAIPRVEYGLGQMRYFGDTGVLEWRAEGEPVYHEQATSSNMYEAVGRNLDIDMREWDREQDTHHSVYRREYPHDYSRSERELIREAERYLRDVEWPRRVRAERRARIFCDGEWTGGCDYAEQPDIKDERGGALDEFLDEFKPQTTPERSDEQ